MTETGLENLEILSGPPKKVAYFSSTLKNAYDDIKTGYIIEKTYHAANQWTFFWILYTTNYEISLFSIYSYPENIFYYTAVSFHL